ncbi:flagellar biosynthesis/type III secretory pathway chaperone [Caldalkalibacillus uzonensis]|uniref:Flagellar biosynthesis/type III secretory pathway chaperone n=1 Tax=Caldalkalibacillus uzonensis TaxID=353224 RepID=A0ABU0CU70_9BACI|nr:flagellar protein FlgN [Caldalkalibacillus uzonensis]MDQ0339899.1 flagellar biosynthesis/type III secretory pathway chaperone [Caldalkalibacillus uzonensis]
MQMLIATLEDLLQAHEAMLEIARSKQDVLIKGDVQGLSALLEKEGQWIKRLSKLEQERQFQVEDYVRRLGLEVDEDVTLSRLLALLPGSENKRKAERLAEQLTETIVKLREQNELNQRLIQDALKAVNHTLDVLTQNESEITYQKPDKQGKGQPGPPPGRGFFDIKA